MVSDPLRGVSSHVEKDSQSGVIRNVGASRSRVALISTAHGSVFVYTAKVRVGQFVAEMLAAPRRRRLRAEGRSLPPTTAHRPHRPPTLYTLFCYATPNTVR